MGMEVTKPELDHQLAAYTAAGLTITEAPGILGQTYFVANGLGFTNARVGRYTGATWHLDCPLKIK